MDSIRYVVVVHGIGEQRQNETVISVVSRCAEVRRRQRVKDCYDVLTLGMACSQTGKAGSSATAPWLEFQGIPLDPSPSPGLAAERELNAPFLGEQSRHGENLRFVDLHWADLLQADIEDVGQSPEVWSDGLLGRLKRKNEKIAADQHARRAPSWAIEILRILKETVTLLRRFTTLRAQKLDETIFTKFLGDVQLYGEYAYCRGQAVRRFHDLMARIEQRHEREEAEREARARNEGESYARREARYTILAHSLGSIMSFDALLYAHAKPAVLLGSPREGAPGLPFPGHLLREENSLENGHCEADIQAFRKQKESLLRMVLLHGEDSAEVRETWKDMKGQPAFRFLDTSWLERVDSFVTLGSPIDKFLVLWWLNYKHLLAPQEWMDPSWIAHRRRSKIRLFNYADEQDPVGHHLDVAQSTPVVKEIFDIEEDRVYNRYAVPGLAHTSYWKDLPLFRRIVHLAVDGVQVKDEDEKAPMEWFNLHTYEKALTYSYYAIPYAVLVLHFFMLTWALFSRSWHGRAIASVLFFSTFLLGRRLIDLSLWWRQVLKAKSCDEKDFFYEKVSAATRFRWRLGLLSALYLGLAGIAFFFSPEALPLPKLGFIGGIFALSLLAWWLLFLDRQSAWTSKGSDEDAMRPATDLNEGTLLIQLISALLLVCAWSSGLSLMDAAPEELPQRLVSSVKEVPLLAVLAGRMEAHADEISVILTAFFSLAALVFSYTWLRFYQIRSMVRGSQHKPDFTQYAGDPGGVPSSPEPAEAPPGVPVAAPLPSAFLGLSRPDQ